MSTPTPGPQPAQAPEPTAEPAADTQPPTPSAPAQPAPTPETDWKAEARKWEARAKENSSAAARLAELEDAQKSEQQRLQEAAEKATRDAAEARQEALRWRYASAHGISPEDAETFLTGADEETLQRQAARLAALRTPAPAPAAAEPGQQPAAPPTPVEHLRPGALPTPPEPTLAERIAAAEKAGDWQAARQLKTQQLYELHQNT